MADGERRARDGRLDSERAAGAAHERRLAAAKLTGDRDDVVDAKHGREATRDGFGLPRGSGGELNSRSQKRPSWTAGSGAIGASAGTGVGASTVRPSSYGSRAKSASSTFSIAGV